MASNSAQSIFSMLDEDDNNLRKQLQDLVGRLLIHPDADSHPLWNTLKKDLEYAISLDKDRKLFISALRENY